MASFPESFLFGSTTSAHHYWTLLDNFEWSLGYGPKFGMVAVDRQTFARDPKPSAYWFGQVARARASGFGCLGAR